MGACMSLSYGTIVSTGIFHIVLSYSITLEGDIQKYSIMHNKAIPGGVYFFQTWSSSRHPLSCTCTMLKCCLPWTEQSTQVWQRKFKLEPLPYSPVHVCRRSSHGCSDVPELWHHSLSGCPPCTSPRGSPVLPYVFPRSHSQRNSPQLLCQGLGHHRLHSVPEGRRSRHLCPGVGLVDVGSLLFHTLVHSVPPVVLYFFVQVCWRYSPLHQPASVLCFSNLSLHWQHRCTNCTSYGKMHLTT